MNVNAGVIYYHHISSVLYLTVTPPPVFSLSLLSFLSPLCFFIRFSVHYQRFALQNKNKRMRTRAQDSDTRTNCYSPGCHTLHYTCSRSHDVISICWIFHQSSNRNTMVLLLPPASLSLHLCSWLFPSVLFRLFTVHFTSVRFLGIQPMTLSLLAPCCTGWATAKLTQSLFVFPQMVTAPKTTCCPSVWMTHVRRVPFIWPSLEGQRYTGSPLLLCHTSPYSSSVHSFVCMWPAVSVENDSVHKTFVEILYYTYYTILY